jgi:hypothetical protein
MPTNLKETISKGGTVSRWTRRKVRFASSRRAIRGAHVGPSSDRVETDCRKAVGDYLGRNVGWRMDA